MFNLFKRNQLFIIDKDSKVIDVIISSSYEN